MVLPREAIGPVVSNFFSMGYIPVFLRKNINCNFPGLSGPLSPSGYAHVLCILLGASLFENRPTDYLSFKNRLDSSVGRASAFGAGSQEFRSGLQHTISIY